MFTSRSDSGVRVRAATRADVIAVVVVVGVMGLVLGLMRSPPALVSAPMPRSPDDIELGPPTLIRSWPATSLCVARLQQIGQAVALCRTQNNGFCPDEDDGGDCGPWHLMLTWVDLLVELGYLPEGSSANRCPEDARPDYVARLRGERWYYSFVNRFGVNETLKPGVRTSYAISDMATYNWREDEFSDASRQIFAIDGWWTWMMCLNAYWSYAPDVFGHEVSIDEPYSYAGMAGWRHANKSANAVFFDGSVRSLPTRKPLNVFELRDKTFDTELAFTWLPGEQTVRASNQKYSGTHTEWNNRLPKLSINGQDWQRNPAMPDELKVSWRSQNNLWTKFPNPANRR